MGNDTGHTQLQRGAALSVYVTQALVSVCTDLKCPQDTAYNRLKRRISFLSLVILV